MKKLDSNKIEENIVITLYVIFILMLAFGSSWVITCGIYKLITLCFGWTFKWSIATGIWLILLLLRRTFKFTVRK